MNTANPNPQIESIWRSSLTLLRPALSLFIVLSVLTGLLYPFLITGVARVFFPTEAGGSLLFREGKAVGSSLIGQPFSAPQYLWGRPSATGPMPYNPLASGGSNLGPTNPALVDTVKARIDTLRAAHPEKSMAIPQDLVTASASGLDPHISPEAAAFQVERIARARGIAAEKVRAIIAAHTQAPELGLFGETRVNVLQVNLDLDAQ